LGGWVGGESSNLGGQVFEGGFKVRYNWASEGGRGHFLGRGEGFNLGDEEDY